MHRTIVHREYTGNFRYHGGFDFYTTVTESIPRQLWETELSTSSSFHQCDKIFCSAWLSLSLICAGTKDNSLLVWDLNQRKRPDIPKFVVLPQGNNPPLSSRCGQHAMKVSPDHSLLACGAKNEAEIAIFSIPDFEPVTVFTGHTDWVFGLDFLSDDIVVSGSRDSTMKMWSVEKSKLSQPIISTNAHPQKTRDLVACRERNNIFTLGIEGEVKQWDAQSFSMSNVQVKNFLLEESNEVVCLAHSSERNILAVGTQNYMLLIDPRLNQPISRIPSQDLDWGVRSLNWNDFIISSGGGCGRISFYDIRYNKYMDLGYDSSLGYSRGTKSYYNTGKGFVARDTVYYNSNFQDMAIPHAAYTHCYDPTGLRLFIGGGPLNFGLKGSYAALW